MVDPSKCPIPPGFRVVGGFVDGFDHFKNVTSYGVLNWGVSKRWKNSDITSAGIVVGFQFRIGPDVGHRFRTFTLHGDLGPVTSGDITIHFPRKVCGGDRGGYLTGIKWFVTPENGYITRGGLDKEIPHGSYGDKQFFESHTYRGEPNPIPKFPQARDGQWHSILAVIWNEHFGIDADPNIGLWYCDTLTHKFKDFDLVGISSDTTAHPMEPNLRPLRCDVFGSNDMFKIEHALQIRIDDVPKSQIEIANVYTAEVVYDGIFPPKNPTICINEAKKVDDAQAEIDRLKNRVIELGGTLSDLTGELLAKAKSEIKNTQEVLIPKQKGVLKNAQYAYMKCAGLHFHKKKISVPGNVQRCETFEEAVKNVQKKVNDLIKERDELNGDMQEPGLPESVVSKMKARVKEIQEDELPRETEALATAKENLEKCKKDLDTAGL